MPSRLAPSPQVCKADKSPLWVTPDRHTHTQGTPAGTEAAKKPERPANAQGKHVCVSACENGLLKSQQPKHEGLRFNCSNLALLGDDVIINIPQLSYASPINLS